MKRLSMVCAAALLAGFLANEAQAQDTVTSVNVVGFSTELLPQAEFILASAPFAQVDGTTNTMLSVFGTTQLAQNDALSLCDRVILWDSATQQYNTWAQWTDNTFYRANNATEWGAGSVPGNPEIPPGTAFWVSPSASTPPAKMLNFSGEVVSVPTQQIDIVAGFQFISYPFSSEITLQDTAFFASGAQNNDALSLSDRITVWQNNAFDTYALWTDGNWYKANNATEWGQSILASNTVLLNEGFIYNAVQSMTWVETNQYLGSLK